MSTLFDFNKENNLITIKQNALELNFRISIINSDLIIAELDDAIIFKVAEKLNLAIYEENENVFISLSQNKDSDQKIFLEFENVEDVALNENQAAIYLTNENYIKLQAIDAKILSFKNNKLLIEFSRIGGKLEFLTNNKNFSALRNLEEQDPAAPVTILTNTESFVFAGSRGPEFSLGMFDSYENAAHKRGRPIRLGVPVISTVPAYDATLSGADLTYFERGEGPDSRTVYFRVVADRELSEQSVKLLIYLPNGEDTVTAPDFINLEKISASGERSVYQGEYKFFIEDTVYSVDGFVYFSVYLDIVQQISLALELDEFPTTYAEFLPPTTDSDYY